MSITYPGNRFLGAGNSLRTGWVFSSARLEKWGIHLKWDSQSSIAYSEELVFFMIAATLQSTDRHHGIVGQERCHFQRDS